MNAALRLPLLLAGMLAIAAWAVPLRAWAQGMLQEARILRTGAFLWDDDGAARGGALSIKVSIADQKLYVYRGGRLIGMSTVSTGMKGHSTPIGDFTVLQKDLWHRSNKYSNAPMPYMQRLTWDGIALHGGHLPGYPASHGCIRLPAAFAKRLFALSTLGVPVTIMGSGFNRREHVPETTIVLRFEDIDWLATSDDALSIPVATARPEKHRTARQPHWASWPEIEAERKTHPQLEYDMGTITD